MPPEDSRGTGHLHALAPGAGGTASDCCLAEAAPSACEAWTGAEPRASGAGEEQRGGGAGAGAGAAAAEAAAGAAKVAGAGAGAGAAAGAAGEGAEEGAGAPSKPTREKQQFIMYVLLVFQFSHFLKNPNTRKKLQVALKFHFRFVDEADAILNAVISQKLLPCILYLP